LTFPPATGNKTTGIRRPHRSNPDTFLSRLQSIERSTRPHKREYWTDATLRKLASSVFSTARQEHFAKQLKALRSWPERSREEILLMAANPIRSPRKGIGNRWFWPKSQLSIEREQVPPDIEIDSRKLGTRTADFPSKPGGRERAFWMQRQGAKNAY
jgi:hypothetical protein